MPAASHDTDRLTRALADRYTVEGQIGAGATAVVYRAIDIRHERIVALKVLRDEVAASIEKGRFLQEIRVLSRLAHPHILPLFDSGEVDGFLYYVMPFVEESLRDRLARERFLPVADAIRFAAEIGEALDFAHTRNIVHRDVKPANILIEQGHAVVADFGISKALDVAAGDTSRSIIMGTPAYMSPEQASGDGHVDGRSDIYSLACTTYEMLAGSVPFAGPTSQAIQRRKTFEEMPSLRTVRPTLAAPLEAVLRQALAVVPADRFATAQQFVAALRSPAAVATSRRKPAFAVAALALVTIATIIGLYFRARARDSNRPLVTGAATRVAVANFTNHTHDPARDDIGFMALDDITEGLQRLPSLSVVPMPSAIAASRAVGVADIDTSAKTLADFGRETGASAVLSGSYYLRGDSLIFYARVTDAGNQRILVAIGPFTAPLAHPELAIAQIRSRARGYFATTTDDRLAGNEEAKEAPPSYEAYSAFSAGMSAYLLNDFSDALTKFETATTIDSAFPTPRLFASLSLSNLGRYAEADSVAHALARMRDHLNPYYQSWLDYRLAFLAGNGPKALIYVRQLASLAPGTKATFNLALAAQETGYVDEALRALESLPPDRGAMREWVQYWDELGTSLHLKGDYSGELNAGERARAMYPDRQYALLPSVRSLAALGRRDELTAVLEKADRLSDEGSRSTLGSLFSEAGKELRAHGKPKDASEMFARAAQWFMKRVQSPAASKADSLSVAEALYEGGRFNEAASFLSKNASDTPTIGLAGLIAARNNQVADARAAMARLDADKRPYQGGAPQVAKARIAALLGDSAAAITALRAAFADGKEYSLWIHRTPEFASLRSNPEFIALMRLRT